MLNQQRRMAGQYGFLSAAGAMLAISWALCWLLVQSSPVRAETTLAGEHGWTFHAPRDEIRPGHDYHIDTGSSAERLTITTDHRHGLQGWWQKAFQVEGSTCVRFSARCRIENLPQPRTCVFPRVLWTDEHGQPVHWDEVAIGPYHPRGVPAEATPEWPREQQDASGDFLFSGVYRVPSAARQAIVELHLMWAPEAKAEWTDIRIEPAEPPHLRKVRLATVHLRPAGPTPEANRQQCMPLIAEAAVKRADLVVLPEVLTFFGTGRTYAECAEPIPGPSTQEFGRAAKEHNLYIVAGLLERDEHLVYNVAVLIGPGGDVLGKYRKVCLPRGEVEAGITAGDSYPVFETPIGRIGMMVCYDGFFPEVARALSENGAEIIAFPVAGCNPLLVAARACENQVYIVSSTYTDVSQNWMISGIYDHQGQVLARAEVFGTIAMAEVDLTWPTKWAGLGDYREEWHRHHPPSASELRREAEPRAAEAAQTEVEKKTSLRLAPLEPAAALKSFQVQAGFEMQLIAAEPLVCDPTVIEYDEDGRAYVAEMRDYPYTDRNHDQPFTERTTDLPLGRIRLLTDDNGDGTFDRSTIFAENLSWPSGLAVSRGGLFVAATPDVWYLKDTDSDGRADLRRKVLTGFRKFNVQALMNNLKWGLDHRLYGAGSSNGGQITTAGEMTAPIVLSTHDFRFDPLQKHFEALAGGGRFGNTFDDWGERFICNIRNPIRHIVVPDHWALQLPHISVPLVHDVAESGDTIPVYGVSSPEPWRVINSQRLSQNVEQVSPRSESVAAGYMTSACGLTFYRGSAYPPEFYGQAFLGEVAGNLIHRQQLTREGTTFRSKRIDERDEFVASTDHWFRPVNFVNAPDGTLHIVDMYRETIEHPWSIPEDIKAQLDLESGRDRGRIYRLAPAGFQAPRLPKLSQRTSVELVQSLTHADAWRRDSAHRLIYERQDMSAVPALRELVSRRDVAPHSGMQPDFVAVGRVLALWSLEGLGALTRDDLLVALDDPVPQVRRQAVRLASMHASLPLPEALAVDSDPCVRAEVAWALAVAPSQKASLPMLVRTCAEPTQDPWLRAAIVTAARNTESALIQELLSLSPSLDENQRDLLRDLATQAAQRGVQEELTSILTLARDASDHVAALAVLSGCAEGLRMAHPQATLHQLLGSSDLNGWLDQQFTGASRMVTDEMAELSSRVAAVELLRHADFQTAAPVLEQLLSGATPTQLQVAAIGAVTSFRDSSLDERLLQRYAHLGPEAQQQLVEAFSRSDRMPQLLTALEHNVIPFHALAVAHRAVLLRSSNPEWKARAVALASQQQAGSRADLVQRFATSLTTLEANAERGEAVFRRECATCHRVEGHGADLGPPLETVQHRSIGELLVAILDPSREVMPNYLEYAVIRKDGTVATGVITSDTANTLTLRKSGDVEQSISRGDIEEVVTVGKSIMPEGLEQRLSEQELADLIAYLRRAH